MKVAIVTSGLLPIPATKGGAIETLLDSFVEENEKKQAIQLTIYSVYDKNAKKITKARKYNKTKYVYITNIESFFIRAINKICKKTIPNNLFYKKKLKRIVNKQDYDYIVIENYPELVFSFKKFKVIPYIHSDVFNIETEKGKEILQNCYKVIAVSNFIRERITQIDNSQGEKVVTVYNSIDFENVIEEKRKEYRQEIRKKYNINERDFVYSFSGRISQEKGVLELIKAFNQLEIPDKKLLIIGGIWYGSQKKNDYLKQIEEISDEKVIYTGYVDHKEVKKILCASDIGVVPSICNEAAGLSVVEFMQTGNIVVASNRGGISEYLNVGDNYLVEYDNKEGFINNLSIAMNDAYKERESLVEKQQANYQYSKRFTVVQNYQEIIEVLESSDKE